MASGQPGKTEALDTAHKNLQAAFERLTTLGEHFGTWGIRLTNGGDDILYSHNEHEPFPAASTNKLSLAFYALRELDTEEEIDLQPPLEGAGKYDEKKRHSSPVSVREAVEDSLIRSGNTAAKSLILHIGVETLNAYFKDTAGLSDTYLEEPAKDQVGFGYTTAADLVSLLRQARQKTPKLLEYLARSPYDNGLRRHQPPRIDPLTVGTKYGALNQEGIRHEAGYVHDRTKKEPNDTVFAAVLSHTRIPKLAAMSIRLMGTAIYEHYFGYRTVPALGRVVMRGIK